jgi:hypothetical protein
MHTDVLMEIAVLARTLRAQIKETMQMPPESQIPASGADDLAQWLSNSKEGQEAMRAIQKLPSGTPAAHSAKIVERLFYNAFPALEIVQKKSPPTEEVLIGWILSDLLRKALPEIKKRYQLGE